MLSSKVIIAIELLLRLEQAEPDRRPYKTIPGTDLSELLENGGIHKSACWSVLRQLMQSGYIVFTGSRNCYAALRDPSQITVLQLVQLFHGDICIGEIYDHRFTTGRRNFRSCSNLNSWEATLYDPLRLKLQQTPITLFRTPEQEQSGGEAASGS